MAEAISKLLARLWKLRISPPDDFPVVFGEKIQRGSIFAAIHSKPLWIEEPLPKKLWCLLRGEWQPRDQRVQELAEEILKKQFFGDESDFGKLIRLLAASHYSREHKFPHLTELDDKKATALEAFFGATRHRLYNLASNPRLTLQLAQRNPALGTLLAPLFAKVPVRSVRWFIDIDPVFVFNEIRKLNHPYADELIAYLYEILFLGQKIAIGLHNFLELIADTNQLKKAALFINAECNGIMAADLLFTYLKAFVEKTTVLIGLVFEIKGIEQKKEHKGRIAALNAGIPERAKSAPYFELIMKLISSETLEDLNSYRNGLLHKKGIADLQPHNYVGLKPDALPFSKILGILIDQHSANSAVFLCALALLCDELMRREPQEVFARYWAEGAETMAKILEAEPNLFDFCFPSDSGE